MRVSLVHITQDAEKIMSYCARVSSSNQENPDYEKLLKYCIKNKHWSIFEMATMCVEIVTSRAITQQILRHRSFHFQEFSQRYAKATSFEVYPARRQDSKNRQNSIDDLKETEKEWFVDAQNEINKKAKDFYDLAIAQGIAKEQARFLLPSSCTSKIYMHGTIRDWIHYLDLRSSNGTQLEHQEIALAIKEIFSNNLPYIARAMEWT
jgi:thymidylate synthase (FAD)